MARVLMMGRLADIAGWRERTYQADTVDQIRAKIVDAHPHLADEIAARSVLVAVNDVVTRGDAAVGAEDEVLFMPPMSGG